MVEWCNYNCCEVYEVNTCREYRCKHSDDEEGILPCEICEEYEERNEEDF